MTKTTTWKGRDIDEMSIYELRAAFRELIDIHKETLRRKRKFDLSEGDSRIGIKPADKP